LGCEAQESTSGTPLIQRAYIWQRTWTPALREVLDTSKGELAGFVALVAEIEPQDRGPPRVAGASVDYASLRETARPIGLALRIGAFGGPFGDADPLAKRIVSLAWKAIEQARTEGVEPAELQLDFDAATSKLDGYRLWIEMLRPAIAPTPLVITVLPTWMENSAFERLIAAADGYVLQVHSLERPKDPDTAFDLCPPQAARAAISRAASYGKPFWVALPTYGYQAWFDQRGELVGLAAEGPELSGARGYRAREIRSDPSTISALVRGLEDARPKPLQGILWYRLPQPGDRLGWPWPTLRAVLQGREPQPSTEIHLQRPEPELVEVALEASGEADSLLEGAVELRWQGARLLAADAVGGYTSDRQGPSALQLRPPPGMPGRLAPGKNLVIGWLRFDRPPEIHAYDASSARP